MVAHTCAKWSVPCWPQACCEVSLEYYGISMVKSFDTKTVWKLPLVVATRKRPEKAPAKMLKFLVACPGLFGKSRGKAWKHAWQKHRRKTWEKEQETRERTKSMAGKAGKLPPEIHHTTPNINSTREIKHGKRTRNSKGIPKRNTTTKETYKSIQILKKYSDTSSINATICWGIIQSTFDRDAILLSPILGCTDGLGRCSWELRRTSRFGPTPWFCVSNLGISWGYSIRKNMFLCAYHLPSYHLL